mmetsp:Transcript_14141/g.28853  ORF Transcript_14141/g.28853 Transcript_14141/m.28853 type:complete len:138 (+) Transcript_14141:222-635(+)
MLSSIISFIGKWSLGGAIMTCDIIYDVTVSILVLLETIVIELFSVMCVLVIDVWKADEIILEPSTPTRDNSCADDEMKGDEHTASSTESINTNRTSGSGSGSDDLRVSYRHLKQEYMKKKRESRTNPIEIVGSQVIF